MGCVWDTDTQNIQLFLPPPPSDFAFLGTALCLARGAGLRTPAFIALGFEKISLNFDDCELSGQEILPWRLGSPVL